MKSIIKSLNNFERKNRRELVLSNVFALTLFSCAFGMFVALPYPQPHYGYLFGLGAVCLASYCLTVYGILKLK